jgi:hypothetical protein
MASRTARRLVTLECQLARQRGAARAAASAPQFSYACQGWVRQSWAIRSH